jgi:DNA-binding Lrp family transcriptional regulator
MKTTAFVLAEATVGKAREVAKALRASPSIKAVDLVTGPYDLIVQVEGDDINAIGQLVVGQIQSIPGIQRTLTLISTPF